MDGSVQAILGPDEVQAYRRDGYVVPRFRLPEADLAQLQSLAMDLVKDNPAFQDKLIPSPHVRRPFEPDATHNINTPRAEEWFRYATRADIMDAVELLLGPDLILWGTALFYKRAAGGPETPWHNDSAFSPITPAVTTSVWIAVFDSKIDNGCLRVIPGTHLRASVASEHHFNSHRSGLIFPNSVDVSTEEEAAARDIELEAGQMLMFDYNIIHGARANQGTRHRAGFTLRFMPATSYFDREQKHGDDPYRVAKDKDYAARPLFLARGIDRDGRNDFRRGHAA